MPDDPVDDPQEAQAAGPEQSLAIGLYIGAIVLLMGLVLTVYGAFDPNPVQQDGSDVNKNLWWGLFMVLVGVVTLALSFFSPRRRAITR
jgi:Ca2+/Na+ antiporter